MRNSDDAFANCTLHFRVQYSRTEMKKQVLRMKPPNFLIIGRPAYFHIHLLGGKLCVEESTVAIKGSSLANEK